MMKLYSVKRSFIYIFFLFSALLIGVSGCERSDRNSDIAIEDTDANAHFFAFNREALFDYMQDRFNRKDFKAIYHIMSLSAQEQLPEDDVVSKISELSATYQKIEDGEYAYEVYNGIQNGRHVFTLYYLVNFSKDDAETSESDENAGDGSTDAEKTGYNGLLKIIVAGNDADYGIFGFFLSPNSR